MVHLCKNPDCNLPIHHKGKHSFIYKKAWEALFRTDDINKIQKAGYCTPRGGAKGGYQNHVNRNSKVIIPYEKLSEVTLDNYKDGYVIRLFPSQYFSKKHIVKEEFKNNPSIVVGSNAFVLYRTYEDFESLPPLPDWQIRSILKYDKKTKTHCIPSNDRRGDIIDRGHYLLRISNSGTNKKQNLFEGPAQGIFAPEYADANTNFLCQAVLAWLIIKTENSPYKENDFEHLKAILEKHHLLHSPHYENNYILHNGKTTCPLCYSSLENIPTQVAWGHATCNTRLGQRQCFSYHSLLQTDLTIEIHNGQERRFLGYTNAEQNFIRSQNGDVWIRISKGDPSSK